MPFYKVVITGSREFTEVDIIQRALAQERIALPNGHKRMIVIVGGAKGADMIAQKLATDAMECNVVIVPADWDHDGRAKAGPLRNRAMLDLNPDVVLAFLKDGAGNVGTTDTMSEAKRRGIPVKEFRQA